MISIDMKKQILQHLPTECPWRDTLYWYDSIDSTNTKAKELARQGAPHGTVLVAGQQLGGRGRLGRSFHSPANLGVYLSVILRPACKPEEIMHLTCSTAVYICDAVQTLCGVRPGVKWINDLVLNGKKLGGILTELSVDPKTGLMQYAIVGIGINCRHSESDFPEELRSIATSLTMAGFETDPAALAAAMITALQQMDQALLPEKHATMARYRTDCITLGKEVTVHQAGTVTPGKALDIDEDGALVVAFPDGSVKAVNSGEVSVRGLYSYI